MGKPTPAADDAANLWSEADLAAANAVSPWFAATGDINVSMWGAGTGSVIIERSFDGGVTAIPLTNLGQAVTFTAPFSEVIRNREAGVLLRFRRTVATAGSVRVRMSQ